jgi:hypothetical protein
MGARSARQSEATKSEVRIIGGFPSGIVAMRERSALMAIPPKRKPAVASGAPQVLNDQEDETCKPEPALNGIVRSSEFAKSATRAWRETYGFAAGSALAMRATWLPVFGVAARSGVCRAQVSASNGIRSNRATPMSDGRHSL